MRAVLVACLIPLGCGGHARERPQSPAEAKAEPGRAASPVAPAAPLPETAFRSEAASPAPNRFETRRIGEGKPLPPRYSGRRVNVDLKNTDVHEAFRLLADVGKVNIVVAGEVSGTITLKLVQVPWDQALDVIARAKNLDVENEGNVLVVRSGSRP